MSYKICLVKIGGLVEKECHLRLFYKKEALAPPEKKFEISENTSRAGKSKR
jgi:hypothetical protein